MNTYCVVLRPPSLVNPIYPRNKRCYLSADSAVRAILTASEDNPEWRAIGIEPSGVFGPRPQSDRSEPAPDNWHAA
jgi:hypothetical protein